MVLVKWWRILAFEYCQRQLLGLKAAIPFFGKIAGSPLIAAAGGVTIAKEIELRRPFSKTYGR